MNPHQSNKTNAICQLFSVVFVSPIQAVGIFERNEMIIKRVIGKKKIIDTLILVPESIAFGLEGLSGTSRVFNSVVDGKEGKLLQSAAER